MRAENCSISPSWKCSPTVFSISNRSNCKEDNSLKDYLNSAKNRFYLNFGKQEFSPVIQVSTAIALDYSREVQNTGIIQPLIITYPSKESAVLWMSVQYLVNEFFSNYMYQSENRIKELNLKSGDKIDIFSTTAVFKRIDTSSNKLIMSFSDDVDAHAAMQNVQFINLARKKMVNKYSQYRKKKKDFLGKRKALTHILNLDLNPNFGALTSKVVLISGRGKAGHFRRQLKETLVYDEPLSETILLDKNLIISPDFECFAGSVDSGSEKNAEFFCKAVKQSLASLSVENSDVQLAVISCLALLDSSLKTKLFVDSYESLYGRLSLESKYHSISNRLQNLYKYHPGIEDDLINDVAAVFVNDLQLFFENPNTIKYLLGHKIPIYVISDRVISESKDLDIYTKIFENELFKDVYRFNWDRNKISSLELELDNGEKFIDHENNNSFCRFVDQRIEIKELPFNEFDLVFNSIESRRFLSSLGDHELLQKAYYQILRPLLYSIKNSIDRPDSVKLINAFEVFNQCFESSSSGLNEVVKESISKSLTKLKSYILSGKQPKEYVENTDDFLFQDISVGDTKFLIPIESEGHNYIHHNDVCSEADKIIFIGYPYREYSFKFIDDSIFKKFIPSVEFVLNQCEANVTANFLRRKISTGYYLERYPDCIEELNQYKVGNEGELNRLLNEVITFTQEPIEDEVLEEESTTAFEEFEQMLNELRYTKFKGSVDPVQSAGHYLLSSNVLHFENGSYVFLPQGWRILTVKESITGAVESRSCKIDDVAVGDIAVIVNVSRKSITEYLEGSKAMLSHLEKLDSWRDILKEFRDQYDDVSELASQLDTINQRMELGGSAENYNVVRWLHDEMMLAPAYQNLKMVLGLKYPKEELSDRAKSILSAKTLILKAKNRLDRVVKEKIAEMIGDSHTSLEDSFTIQVQGIEVRGKKNEIVGIEKRSDLKIEYHSTMKFLN